MKTLKKYQLLVFAAVVFSLVPNYQLYGQTNEGDTEAPIPIISFDLPADINTITKYQLVEINLLSDQQIESLIKYRNENGQLLALEELQVIPYWEDLYLKIDFERFLKVKQHKKNTNRRLIFWSQYKVTWDKDDKEKYDGINAIYGLGNKRIHGIYRSGKGLGIAIDLETDKKESGIDHYSFYVDIPVRNKWRFSVGNHQILMSDQLSFGRQTSLRGYGTGVEAFYWMPKSAGIIPALHTETTLGFNGFNSQYNTKHLSVNILQFYNKRDASPHPTVENAGRSIRLSGIHTTEGQLSTKNNLTEYGGSYSIKYKLFSGKYKGTVWQLYRKWDYPLTYKPFTVSNALTDYANIAGIIQELKLLQGIFIAQSIWSQANGWGFSFQYLRPFTRYFSLGFRGQWHDRMIEIQSGQLAQRYIQARIEFTRKKKWFYIMQLTRSQKMTAVKEAIFYWKDSYYLNHHTQWGRTYRKTLAFRHQFKIGDFDVIKHWFTIDARIYKIHYNLRTQLYYSGGWSIKEQAMWKSRCMKLGFTVALYNTDSYADRIYFIDHNTDFARQLTMVYGRGVYTSVLVKWRVISNLHFQTLLTRNCKYSIADVDNYLDTRQCRNQVYIKLLWRQ